MEHMVAANGFMKVFRLEDESLVLVTRDEADEEETPSPYEIGIRFEFGEVNTRIGLWFKDEEKRDLDFDKMTYEKVNTAVCGVRKKFLNDGVE